MGDASRFAPSASKSALRSRLYREKRKARELKDKKDIEMLTKELGDKNDEFEKMEQEVHDQRIKIRMLSEQLEKMGQKVLFGQMEQNSMNNPIEEEMDHLLRPYLSTQNVVLKEISEQAEERIRRLSQEVYEKDAMLQAPTEQKLNQEKLISHMLAENDEKDKMLGLYIN